MTDLESKINEWLAFDKNPVTHAEIQSLKAQGNLDELSIRLLNRVTFGTAGLRARMGAGYSMLNDLVIIQTCQGLGSYLIECAPESLFSKGIVIGYDARHNSQRFAQLSATVFVNLNIPVTLYSRIAPTPLVPYAIRKYGYAAGIVITASHNPKDDNGYKLYWHNGVQIIPPHDSNIQNSIKSHLRPLDSSWDTSVLTNSSLVTDCYEDYSSCYLEMLTSICQFPGECVNPVSIVYTAMHGVAGNLLERAFLKCGFPKFIAVKQQWEPDPEFPTVKFPNPEEKGALNIAFQVADAHNSSIVFANDPDGDRFVAAEKQPNGVWHQFSGNEIAALFASWALKKENISDISKCAFVSSTVSSHILETIAKHHGCHFSETLTGFKWIANKAEDYMKGGNDVLFCFEEAIGFMYKTNVLDKDGISAAVVFAEMVQTLYARNSSLMKQLSSVYDLYGIHVSHDSYYISHDKQITDKIFQRIYELNNATKKSFPIKITSYKITGLRDLNTGYDTTKSDLQPLLPVSKSSHCLTYYIEDNIVLSVRTSGTEPKIKYYSEFVDSRKRFESRNKALQHLKSIVECIMTELLQPSENNLQCRV